MTSVDPVQPAAEREQAQGVIAREGRAALRVRIMMAGETNLDTLLAGMAPELLDGEYVFCTFENARYGDRQELEPIAAVRESEGLTLIIPKTRADASSLPYDTVQRCITVTIHSSLDAVGLTAAFSRVLANHEISANVVAGYYHDHIFVQSEQAERALRALAEFAG